MRDFLEITKALSDVNRVRILMALNKRELCVCQITELLELAPSTVSKHMSILDHARLVESRKDGRWVYYRLVSEEVKPLVAGVIEWMIENLGDDKILLQDDHRLKDILDKGCLENRNSMKKMI
ncbi:MAG: winged helix-turn-helix transcriptional regulator [Candidatus Latescibacteria bacterium]|nr:winged helix-turn-helix transcriptional regulator [Candidatus Latescibacterota bacterium]